MEKWEPDADPHQARRIGKTTEEVCELGAVLARISIQGINAIDPATNKSNRLRLLEETADLEAQMLCNSGFFDWTFEERRMYIERVHRKYAEMKEWENHFPD